MVDVAEFQDQVQNTIQEYGVNVTLYPVTHSYSNITGDEVGASGAGVTHKVLWNHKLWSDSREKPGEFNKAENTIVTNGSVAITQRDLVLYAGSMYEVDFAQIRRWQGSGLYVHATLYAMNGS